MWKFGEHRYRAVPGTVSHEQYPRIPPYRGEPGTTGREAWQTEILNRASGPDSFPARVGDGGADRRHAGGAVDHHGRRAMGWTPRGRVRARFHPVGAGQSGATGAGVPESEPLGGAVEMMEFFLASPLRRSLSARCPGFGSEAGSSRRCARRLSEARCRSLRTQRYGSDLGCTIRQHFRHNADTESGSRMTNNAENPIEMIYSSPPDDEKSHPRLDASTTPSRVHCPKCQVDVVPKHRGLCPGCGRFLSSNKLAQRYFEDTSARKKHLDKLLSEFQPSTVEANFACEMLANNRAELEHARCGTPEHQRLIASSLELFAILKASKVRSSLHRSNISRMMNSQTER